jgi:hypothetical protein
VGIRYTDDSSHPDAFAQYMQFKALGLLVLVSTTQITESKICIIGILSANMLRFHPLPVEMYGKFTKILVALKYHNPVGTVEYLLTSVWGVYWAVLAEDDRLLLILGERHYIH